MELQTKLRVLDGNIKSARRELVKELFSADSDLHIRSVLVLDDLLYKLELAIQPVIKPVKDLTPLEVAEQLEAIEEMIINKSEK